MSESVNFKVSQEESKVIVTALKSYAHRLTVPMADNWSRRSVECFELASRLEDVARAQDFKNRFEALTKSEESE